MTSNAPIISVLHVGQAAMAKQGAVILPPLLENLPTKRSKEYYEWFCLGMGEGTESSEDNSSAESEALAPRKKMKLSVRKEKDKENRWQFVDETKEQALGTKFVPKNTVTSTKWAVSNFVSWHNSRNARFRDEPDKQVPMNLLESTDGKVLSKWLALYAAETRKHDGSQYSPKSLYLLLTGVLRHMRTLNPICPNVLDTADQQFSHFHNAMDNILRELRLEGVGSTSKEAEALMKDEEESLWESGVLSTENLKGLLHAVFFLNGKNFCLQWGEEHHQLKLSQVVRCTDPLKPTRWLGTNECEEQGCANVGCTGKWY